MPEFVVTAQDREGKALCVHCLGSGWVSPWLDEQEYPCPECQPDEYQRAEDYFEIADALELQRIRGPRPNGLSDERVARAERDHLQEQPFTDRSIAQEFTERKRAAGW